MATLCERRVCMSASVNGSGQRMLKRCQINCWGFCAGQVSLRVDNNQAIPIPVSVQPNFLNSLQYCVTNVIDVNPPGTATGRVSGAPGYQSLLQTSGLLQLLDTGFTDLTSFASLQCPPNVIDIRNNDFMTSLTGLNGLSPADNLFRVIITGNRLLRTAGAFAPLTRVLGCVGTGAGSTGSSLIGEVDVQVDGCPIAITSINQLCAYVTSPPATACPA
jgi:hypothetical protein